MSGPSTPGSTSGPSGSDASSSDARVRVVAAAEGELGEQDPSKYWEEVLPEHQQGTGFKGHWCGGFALWCLRQAGLARNIDWQIGRGFCFQLPRTSSPEPGDIAYIDQPFQHHAVVVTASGNSVTTVDGNQPGSSVQLRTRPRSAITAFFSIEDLIQEANAA